MQISYTVLLRFSGGVRWAGLLQEDLPQVQAVRLRVPVDPGQGAGPHHQARTARTTTILSYFQWWESGSGIRCLCDPRSGIRNRFVPDPGSQTYIFELNDNFLGKKIYNSLLIGLKIFLRQFKNKIIFNCVIFVATKKQFFHPSLLLLFWIRDPR